MQTASLTVDVACSQAFLCTSRAWWPRLGSAAELRASLKSLQPAILPVLCGITPPPKSFWQTHSCHWREVCVVTVTYSLLRQVGIFSLPQFGGWKLLQCCKVSSQDWGWYFCLVFWQHLQRKRRLSHYPTLVRLTGTCVLRGMTGNKWASSCWVQQNFRWNKWIWTTQSSLTARRSNSVRLSILNMM